MSKILLFVVICVIGCCGQPIVNQIPAQAIQVSQPLFHFSANVPLSFQLNPVVAAEPTKPIGYKPVKPMTRTMYGKYKEQIKHRNDLKREKYELYSLHPINRDVETILKLGEFDFEYNNIQPFDNAFDEISFYDTAKNFGELDGLIAKGYPMLERANAMGPSTMTSPFNWHISRDEFMRATNGDAEKYSHYYML